MARVQIMVALPADEWNEMKKQIPGIQRLTIEENPATHQAELMACLHTLESSPDACNRERLIVVTPPLEHEDVKPMCERLLEQFPPKVDVYVVFKDKDKRKNKDTVVRYRSRTVERSSLTMEELVDKLRRVARHERRKG